MDIYLSLRHFVQTACCWRVGLFFISISCYGRKAKEQGRLVLVQSMTKRLAPYYTVFPLVEGAIRKE